MYESREPVHTTHVDHVPRVSGPPSGHDQLLHQFPHLLFRVQAVQDGPLQHLLPVLSLSSAHVRATTSSQFDT